MSTITFDTHLAVTKLRTAGFSEKQAEAVVAALSNAQEDLVTKSFLDAQLNPIRTDITVMKWMMGLLLAGVLSLVLKAFF